jgi:DNA-binding response OmpR family regulator
MKILIVEDDRNYRALLYEFLHALDHDVLAVSDALHAVSLLNDDDNGVDVVLMDLRMPRLGGDEVMETFANWSRCKSYFIVMSGVMEVAKYASHPRVVGVLHKPFKLAELGALLKKAEPLLKG